MRHYPSFFYHNPNGPKDWRWDCSCGARNTGFNSKREAEDDHADHARIMWDEE